MRVIIALLIGVILSPFVGALGSAIVMLLILILLPDPKGEYRKWQ